MSYTMPYEISVGKFLYLNSILDADTQEELVHFLKDQSEAFSWEYTDMWGIHPNTCIHLIYTHDLVTRIRKPHRRMNPTLKDTVKEEIHKLLNIGFIYPI